MRRVGWVVALGVLLAGSVACNKKRDTPVQVEGPPAELGFAQDRQQVERAPIELTGSDGTGLQLVSLTARAVVDDPLAYTELHLTFHNPEPRRREGRFTMRLPEAAAISRFAMRVGGQLMEGEVVEKRRAEQVYEDFLHRKQDPALLTQAAGNEFSARVFPIEANEDKEIIIAYSEELALRGKPYRVPLAGLARLESLKVEVLLGSSSATGLESSAERPAPQKLVLERQGFEPASDLLLRIPKQELTALRSGDLAVLRVVVPGKPENEPIDNLTVLFDTSASRALGLAAQIEQLSALLAELVRQQGRDFALRIVAFDQETEEIYAGQASALGLRDKGKLLARDALGATDLSQALALLASADAAPARVLIVTDGVVTAGDESVLGEDPGASGLPAALAQLATRGVARVDVLATGGVRDAATLASLTQGKGVRPGSVLDGDAQPAWLAKRMLHKAEAQVALNVPGASWVEPQLLRAVQPGDEQLVFVELPAAAPLSAKLGGSSATKLKALEAPRPLLERAWARAKIEALTRRLHETTDDTTRATLEREILRLSTQQRVLSELTSLLVLESDNDYRRFGIERTALGRILQVGEEGLELIDRAATQPVPQIARDDRPPPPPSAPEPETKSESEGAAAQPAPTTRRAEPEPPSDGTAPPREMARADSNRASAKGLDEEEPASSGRMRPASRGAAPQAEPPRPSAPAAAPPPAKVARAEVSDALDTLGAAAATSGAGLELRGGSGAAARPGANMAGGTAQGLGALGSAQEIAAPAVLEARASVMLHAVTGLEQAATSAVLRGSLTARARACYQRGELRPDQRERVYFDISVSDRGSVSDAYVTSGGVADSGVKNCLLAAVRALQFPKPEGGSANLQAGVELFTQLAAASAPASAATLRPAAPRKVSVPGPSLEQAYTGTLAQVLEALRAGQVAEAMATAKAARERDPADAMGLIALGEVLEAQHELGRAARAYGSLIDLFPARADLRRMAGARLERLGEAGLALAVDTYRRALAQRSDHPSAHRLLAFALLKQGKYREALWRLVAAHARSFPEDRFPGVKRVLSDDVGLAAAAWLQHGGDEGVVHELLAHAEIMPANKPSLRFVLNWETDANDVDFHIYDGRGGHASYLRPKLGSGGSLYADVTSGYGPECFAIDGASRAFPYVLQAHYFARGPMGYGMGKLEVIQHDGKGNLLFAEHPFVIMKDKAFVELARINAPLR
jgi:hypothetical protein